MSLLDRIDRRLAAWVGVSLALGAIPALIVLASGTDFPWQTALAGATICICAAPIARAVADRRFDLFEPIVFAALMLLLLFGIRPLWMAATGEQVWPTGRDADVSGWMDAATFGGFLGSLLFVTGYEAGRAFWRRRIGAGAPSRAADPRWVTAVAIAMGVLGLILWLVSLTRAGSLAEGLDLALGGRSAEAQRALTSSEYLTSAPILAACGALLLVLTTGGRPTRRQLTLILALVAIPCVIFALGGGRRFIVPSVGIPLVAFAIMRAWRPRPRLVATAVPLAFLVIVLFPIIRSEQARVNAGGLLPAIGHNLTHPDEPIAYFFEGPDTEGVAVFAVEISTLANETDYFYGAATFGDILLAPVPSAIFPDKPQTARDQLLTAMIGSGCDPAGAGCPDWTALGTFYQDFGVPSLLIGMGLLGLGSAGLWELGRRRPASAVPVLLAASWAVMLPILLRAGWMPAFAWWLFFVVPTFAALWLLTSERLRAVISRRQAVPEG
jgi:hypothetical protein